MTVYDLLSIDLLYKIVLSIMVFCALLAGVSLIVNELRRWKVWRNKG